MPSWRHYLSEWFAIYSLALGIVALASKLTVLLWSLS